MCYPFRRGQGRIIDRSFLRSAEFREPLLHVRTVHGFAMDILPNDLIGRHIYFTGQFDRTIADVLLTFARDNDRIIDIGANVGYISAVLLHSLPRSIVVSVEPNEAVFKLLIRNVARVGNDRARPICVAISDHTGTGHLLVWEENTGGARLLESDHPASTEGVVNVELINGRDLVRRTALDHVDLVKIDVEGHETQVLHGMRDVIASDRPRAIVFECYDHLYKDKHPIVTLLDALDYRVFGIKKKLLRWHLLPLQHLCERRIQCHDYVARPQELVARERS